MGLINWLLSSLKLIVVPYRIDSAGLNFILAIQQIGLAMWVCFGVDPNSIGMPWNRASSGLALFEVSPAIVMEMSGYLPPVSLAPKFFALLFTATKTVGSLLVILGLGTRLIGLLYFLIAVLYLYNINLIENFNFFFPIVFIVFSVLLLFFGGGRFSFDYLIGRKAGWIDPLYKLSN